MPPLFLNSSAFEPEAAAAAFWMSSHWPVLALGLIASYWKVWHRTT
jgi:hypothetical protein